MTDAERIIDLRNRKLRKYDTPEKFWDAIADYFSDATNRPYLLQDLATHMGISTNTLNKYGKREGYRRAYNIARQMVEVDIAKSCLLNRYNAYFGKFLLETMGWADKASNDSGVSVAVTIVDDIRRR